MPEVGAAPQGKVAGLRISAGFLDVPITGKPEPNAARKRVGGGIADIGGAVVEVVDVEGLVHQLPLRLQLPVVADGEWIATLQGCGKAEAAGLDIVQTEQAPARCHIHVVPGSLHDTVEIPVVLTETGPVAAN